MEWLPEIVVAVVIVVFLVIPHVVLRDRKEKTTKAGEEKEICIRCKVETAYRRDTPIDRRKHYVDGAGQLCDKCWNEFLLDEYREKKDNFLKALETT